MRVALVGVVLQLLGCPNGTSDSGDEPRGDSALGCTERGYSCCAVCAAAAHPESDTECAGEVCCDACAPKLWGAGYTPYESMVQYGMTANVTGIATTADAVLVELAAARAHGVDVILSVGSTDECLHVTDNVFQYATATAYFDAILTVALKEQLPSYVADGTLLGLRFYDEPHNCSCCNTSYLLSGCDEAGTHATRDTVGLPVGSDGAPGFADLLHHLQFSNGGLPLDLPVGSTGQFSYSAYLVERMNALRLRDGQPPLAPDSLLGSSSFRAELGIGTDAFTTCFDQRFAGSLGELFFLLYPTCQTSADDVTFWSNYISFCQWSTADMINSWAWHRGTRTFQQRIEALEAGEVPGLTLEDLRAACGRL